MNFLAEMVEFLEGLTFYFLPLGFGSKRIGFFEKEVRSYGGRLGKGRSDGPGVTHVIVEESLGRDPKASAAALKSHGFVSGGTQESVKFVRVSWLIECLGQKSLLETEPYEIDGFLKVGKDESEPNGDGQKEAEDVPEKKRKIDEESIAAVPSTSIQSSEGTWQPNRIIIDELEKLVNAYAVRNDKWRSHAYQKAIYAIKKHGKEITTFQEARSVPGIGEKMASKIMEIRECGKLNKIEEIVDEKTKILQRFCQVWGAGPTTAEGWYAIGCRSLEDVQSTGKLTKQQQIGLKYYEDLLERIPRSEVVEIFEKIKEEASDVDERLNLELVGSYRRGKLDCGDVDIMIVNSGSKSPGELLIRLTSVLREKGYLTDDLINLGNNQAENEHRKYFGIFKLPGNRRLHRRLDLFVVTKEERPAALFHYTGSALYNRKLKLLAASKGMILTEHGLYAGTLRKGSEVASRGQVVPTLTEEDIFKALGLTYKVPEERDY